MAAVCAIGLSRSVPRFMTQRPSPLFLSPRHALLALGLALAAGAALADEYTEVQRLQGAGQSAQAFERADRYIAANPQDPQMRFIKANLLSALGRTDEALAMLTTLTSDYPELPEPWNNLAVLYAARGQLDKADDALAAALRINPAYGTALENRGDVRVRQALESYLRARQLDAASAARLTPRIEALQRLAPASATAAPAASAPPAAQ